RKKPRAARMFKIARAESAWGSTNVPPSFCAISCRQSPSRNFDFPVPESPRQCMCVAISRPRRARVLKIGGPSGKVPSFSVGRDDDGERAGLELLLIGTLRPGDVPGYFAPPVLLFLGGEIGFQSPADLSGPTGVRQVQLNPGVEDHRASATNATLNVGRLAFE